MAQLGQMVTMAGRLGETVDPAVGAAQMSLVFRAGALLCALRLDEVIETMRPLPVQPLAGTPAFVRGISIVRGVPTPVIDVARLLGGADAPVVRFITVGTERGSIAFATGPILGLRPTVTGTDRHHTRLLGVVPARLVAAIGTVDNEPLIQLQSMRMVPDEVWAAAAGDITPTGVIGIAGPAS
jgi:purine-binding chemotaxis protein CheW